MRAWVILLAIAVNSIGCALVVPDFYAREHVWFPSSPHVRVELIPQGHVCATEKDPHGLLYHPAVVLIHVIELPPLPATISLNRDAYVAVLTPSRAFVFRWKAGVGAHRVDTDVGGHKATRVLSVYSCGKDPTVIRTTKS